MTLKPNIRPNYKNGLLYCEEHQSHLLVHRFENKSCFNNLFVGAREGTKWFTRSNWNLFKK